MDMLEKLEILADAAKYDVACTSSGADKRPAPGGGQSGRGSCNGVYGHEHGGADGRYERTEPLSDGCAAAGSAARSRSTGSARERLDVQLRTKRYHRQFLPELRQQKTGAQASGRKLEMPAVRCDGKRKVLPRMRHEKARSTGRRLDVQLRRSKQGKVLRRMRN